MFHDIIYPWHSFNRSLVIEVRAWVNNYIKQLYLDVIIPSCIRLNVYLADLC